MIFFTTQVPLWVSITFLIAFIFPTLMIANLVRTGATNAQFKNPNNIYWSIIIFYLLYLIYVTIACQQGLFAEATLPPKILRFTMIPLLLFLLVVVFNLPKTKRILKNIDTADLISIHIFRLIGSFFIILYLFKALPAPIAMIAGTGDLVTAISSIFVAQSLRQKKSYSKTLAYVWNTFGFLDIIATSVTAFILTKLSIETGSQGVDTLGEFPFCFIPAFAPATIIFLHLCIYRKLFSEK